MEQTSNWDFWYVNDSEMSPVNPASYEEVQYNQIMQKEKEVMVEMEEHI